MKCFEVHCARLQEPPILREEFDVEAPPAGGAGIGFLEGSYL